LPQKIRSSLKLVQPCAPTAELDLSNTNVQGKVTLLTQNREDAKADNDLKLKRSSAYLRASASLR
jgi:hypothetical protein